jgi:hypothetical protein
MTEKPYSSAVVTMLDRDSQAERGAMLYPITRVALNEVIDGTVKAVRVFFVSEDGKWVEQQ